MEKEEEGARDSPTLAPSRRPLARTADDSPTLRTSAGSNRRRTVAMLEPAERERRGARKEPGKAPPWCSRLLVPRWAPTRPMPSSPFCKGAKEEAIRSLRASAAPRVTLVEEEVPLPAEEEEVYLLLPAFGGQPSAGFNEFIL